MVKQDGCTFNRFFHFLVSHIMSSIPDTWDTLLLVSNLKCLLTFLEFLLHNFVGRCPLLLLQRMVLFQRFHVRFLCFQLLRQTTVTTFTPGHCNIHIIVVSVRRIR